MQLSQSWTVTTALAATVALAALCAPSAAADPGSTACEPGQIVIDGQCNVPPPPNPTVAPAAGTGSDANNGNHGDAHR